MPDMKVTNRANILLGIDVRGDGGYIVAPPSVHKSGMQYSWMREFVDKPINPPPPCCFRFFSIDSFLEKGWTIRLLKVGAIAFLRVKRAN